MLAQTHGRLFGRPQRGRSPIGSRLADPPFERFPTDRPALSEIGAACLTQPDELGSVGKDQVLSIDGKGEDHRHWLAAAGDQESFTSLGPIHNV